MIAALFGSTLRAHIIGWMMTHPDEWFFVRRLTGIIGADSTNTSRELAKLADLGILLSRTEGRQKYYRANEQCPVFPELRGLAVKTAGAADILRAALSPLSTGIHAAFIHGSLAEGRERASSDVDIIIVGNVPPGEVVKALGPAQTALGREVNPVIYAPDEFRRRVRAGHHFVTRVMTAEKVFLIGDADELEKMAR